ncbi:MAG TPA: ATP-binding cassette domain-containing protein [Candidatus Paceibacterota bacterium]|nr:ATP-binding cassette domain-containing protein [Verrucomicrobiota bacterium]HOX03468.1 ATP-binding cassette domain-containing protein [Verrucomicrobiota bacterium]HRZ91703.1 ATP-binding cassette domain-containing protein [Candidatus Paceibacterota bacterium]
MNPPEMKPIPRIVFDRFSAWYGRTPVLREVSLEVEAGQRLAIIGPAGSGKTTLLRCVNRLPEEAGEFHHQGTILLDGQDIFDPKVDIRELRRRAVFLSAPPTALPVSVFENVAIALRMGGEHRRDRLYERVEASLKETRLWDQLKDQLDEVRPHLPMGVVSRLGLARALAVQPIALLLDEPGFGLDNLTMTLFEDLLQEIAPRRAVLFATNDVQQAARASDRTAFLLDGLLVECAPTRDLFTRPSHEATQNFITQRF